MLQNIRTFSIFIICWPMKVFVRNLFLFLVVLATILGALTGGASLYMNRETIRIPQHKNILILGDSHTECAIDDSVFARAANFSKSATAFVYSYAALRKLIADNPQIDTVLLSYHSSSLSFERERGWIFDETMLARQVPVFLPYFSASEYSLFFFKPEFYKPALQTPLFTFNYHKLKDSIAARQLWVDQNIGNYREFTWSNFAKDTAATKPLTNPKPDTVSTITVNYIRKVAAFCKERNIELILLNAPVYQWNRYVNVAEFDTNRRKYFSDIHFLDYSDFPVADSCRFDIWHLNAKGAQQFSRYLELNLAKDLIGHNNQ